MGILKKTEELIPVTCAILPDDERESFFEELRKKASGNLQRIAKAVGTTAAVVQDWMRGRVNVPYHALQVMADEFHVPLPPVTELRREMQLVVEPPKPRHVPLPPEPARPEPKPARQEHRPSRSKGEGQPRREREHERQPRRQARGRKGGQDQARQHERQPRRQERGGRQQKPRAEARKQQPKGPAGPARPQPSKDPKLSDRLAYWTGVLLARASVRDGVVSLSADRRIGQNFAGGWASLTGEIFGIKPELTMSEDRKAQTASFQASELEAFLGRMSFKEGAEPAKAPGAPRWAWSNPDWKASFLKGIVDSTAQFHRAPRIELAGLSEELKRSAAKMLGSLGFAPKTEGDIVLEGREAVAAYFEKVGTRNMKLRDQISAYLRGAGEPSEDEAGGIAQETQPEASAAAPAEAPPSPSAEPSESVPEAGPGPETSADPLPPGMVEEDEGPDPFNR